LGYPSGVVTCKREVVNISAKHGKHPMLTVDIYEGVGFALFPAL
jgi:hypothetical protein